MAEGKSHEFQIFDKQTKTWFKVSPDQFEEYDRERRKLRQREQYYKRCNCTRDKWWLCDGMCQDCEFHSEPDTISLDFTDIDEKGEEGSLHVCVTDKDRDPFDELQTLLLTQHILARLNELMPEAAEIGRLRLLGMTDKAIADALGIKRTTFRSRIEKARKVLQKEFGEFFSY